METIGINAWLPEIPTYNFFGLDRSIWYPVCKVDVQLHLECLLWKQ